MRKYSNELTVEMSRAAFDQYASNWHAENFSKEALVRYLNETGGYMGIVTDIAIVDE